MSRNIYFDYLGSAYVQVGKYNIKKFYRPGRHHLQGVGNVTADIVVDTDAVGAASAGATPTEVYDFVVPFSGSYTVSFTLEAKTQDTTAQVQLDGADVGPEFEAEANGDDIDAVVRLTNVVAGQEITIIATGHATGPVNASVVDIAVAVHEYELPETFTREWATFGTDVSAGYDAGAYGIGVGSSSTVIEVPVVKRVHLLYKYDVESTRQERTLVQVDAASSGSSASADLGTSTGIGVVTDALARRVFTEDQFYAAFAPKGFNRFGAVWPSGMQPSAVGELRSVTGNFVDVSGSVVSNVTLYVAPLYIENERPLFDHVYMIGVDPSGAVSNYDVPGYLVRWLGGVGSDTIAPINRDGAELSRSNPIHGITETKLTIDGVQYDNADAYNVTNYRRH